LPQLNSPLIYRFGACARHRRSWHRSRRIVRRFAGWLPRLL